MAYRLEAAYYRTALLLGLVKGDEVHQWAEGVILNDPAPPHELVDFVLIAPTDLSALRNALWPLALDPEPQEVLSAIAGLLETDLRSGRRSVADTVRVLRQMRGMLKLPPAFYDELNEALVSHGLSTAEGGTIGSWLHQFAAVLEEFQQDHPGV